MLARTPKKKRTFHRSSRAWEYNIKMNLKGIGCWIWAGFIWLRIGTSGGILWIRQWTFEFQERRGISWLAEWLLVSRGRIWFMEFFLNLVCVCEKHKQNIEPPQLIFLFCATAVNTYMTSCDWKNRKDERKGKYTFPHTETLLQMGSIKNYYDRSTVPYRLRADMEPR